MSSCNGILLRIGSKRVCFPIYYEMPWWWLRPWPGPDPREKYDIPLRTPKEILEANRHLQNFIEEGLIEKNTIVEISTLHNIRNLTGNLSPDLKKQLNGVIDEQLVKINKQIAFE
jgi:hypothetical protein